MAKGYPAPKTDAPPVVPELVEAGRCPICKRRPAATGSRYCRTCAAALSSPGTAKGT